MQVFELFRLLRTREALGAFLLMLCFAPELRAQQTVAGTYHLRVCKATRPCASADSVSMIVTGILVMAEDSLGFGDLPPIVQAWFKAFYPRTAKSCYVLRRHRRPGAGTTHAGIRAVQWSGWSSIDTAADSIQFSLYTSPDAGYSVRARIAGDTVRGIGRSVIAPTMGDLTSWGTDVVIATRIGPADPTPCIRSAVSGGWPVRARD